MHAWALGSGPSAAADRTRRMRVSAASSGVPRGSPATALQTSSGTAVLRRHRASSSTGWTSALRLVPGSYSLNRSSNALRDVDWRAEPVSRSTVVRASNRSQVLKASFGAMRAEIVCMHS
jgi:hypothetical protein